MKTEEKPFAWNCYRAGTDALFEYDEIPLGPWTSHSLLTDPKHMAFALSRYKFGAKMLAGKKRVIEVGCGDGFGIPILAQAVDEVICVDWDPRNLEGCARRLHSIKNISYHHIDLNENTFDFEADAAFSADVIEHIEPEKEARFMENLCALLKPSSMLVMGTPNITSEAYASDVSRAQHINLKSHDSLKALSNSYFKHTFMFGMNDEVVHTGYGPMSHYLWAMGVERRT